MFYTFNQNNSGGRFTYDESKGLTHVVIVEASSAQHAKERGEEIGLYWDGVQNGMDCNTCGDRWSYCYMDDDDGKQQPEVYGKPAYDFNDWFFSGFPKGSVAIHYLSGVVEWIQCIRKTEPEKVVLDVIDIGPVLLGYNEIDNE